MSNALVDFFKKRCIMLPLTEEGISDFLIQGKTGTILPKIVEEVIKRNSV